MLSVSEPKKHHYIPIFYLRAWTNQQGNLCEFSRPYKSVVYKWRHPSATGYQKNLYSVPGASPEDAEAIEKEHMGLVDSTAAQVHQKFLADGKDDLIAGQRVAWSRFLYAMMFRNPEHIAGMDARFKAAAPALIEEYREIYPTIRAPSDPLTFDEFKDSYLSRGPNVSVLPSIPFLLGSRSILGEIQSFHFWTATLGSHTNPTFLTSDRPIIMNNGLAKPEAHIVIPLSPRVLFIAARGRWLHDQISKMPNTTLAKLVNEKVARQSHRYVYGADTSQQRFVSKRLGEKVPSTPMD